MSCSGGRLCFRVCSDSSASLVHVRAMSLRMACTRGFGAFSAIVSHSAARILQSSEFNTGHPQKKLDAAIDALVDALAELPEHELEGWQRGNRLGLRIICELGRRYPGIVQATGPVRRNSA